MWPEATLAPRLNSESSQRPYRHLEPCYLAPTPLFSREIARLPRKQFFVDYKPSGSNEIAQVQVGSGDTTDMLRLLPQDKTLELTLYVDNTFTEAYWMGGRVAMTIITPTSGGQDDVTVAASQPGVTVSATAWEVGSIWVSPEVVKRTKRHDVI